MNTTSNGWSVSATSGTGINGSILHVYKHHQVSNGSLWQYGQANGLQFADSAAAFQYASEHGYTHQYNRNRIKFHGNRSFRKHTGRECLDPQDVKMGQFKRATLLIPWQLKRQIEVSA